MNKQSDGFHNLSISWTGSTSHFLAIVDRAAVNMDEKCLYSGRESLENLSRNGRAESYDRSISNFERNSRTYFCSASASLHFQEKYKWITRTATQGQQQTQTLRFEGGASRARWRQSTVKPSLLINVSSEFRNSPQLYNCAVFYSTNMPLSFLCLPNIQQNVILKNQ